MAGQSLPDQVMINSSGIEFRSITVTGYAFEGVGGMGGYSATENKIVWAPHGPSPRAHLILVVTTLTWSTLPPTGAPGNATGTLSPTW